MGYEGFTLGLVIELKEHHILGVLLDVEKLVEKTIPCSKVNYRQISPPSILCIYIFLHINSSFG